MRKEELFEVLGQIDEDYISQARMTARKKSAPGWLKWVCIAACAAVVVMAATFALPEIIAEPDATLPSVEATGFERRYIYHVSEGQYAQYVSGKVIGEDRLGDKAEVVSVTAGWENAEGTWLSRESLRAEVYLIAGVSKDVAVALRFLDKGEALTTTHYYVIMNPGADLSAVEEYIIPSPDMSM